MSFKPLALFFIGLLWLSNGAIVIATSAADSPQERAQPLSIQVAVATALEDNPGLEAMRLRALAMAAVPSQEGALPDPRLSLNMMNVPVDSFDFNQEAMTQLQLGLSQQLPFPGKLALRAEAAEHQSRAARWQVDEMRLRLVRDVKILWWELYYTDRAVEIVVRNLELMRQFVAIAQTKYKVGMGLQQDVLLAQLELSKLHDRAISLKGMRLNQLARFNALLGLATDTDLLLPQTVNETLTEISDEPGLLAVAEKRPLVAAYQSHIDVAQARLGLARKGYAPDFMLAATYGARGGINANGSDRADLLTVMLSMNLPLYTGSRQDKAVDQRKSELLASRYQRDDIRLRVAAEVSQALGDYQRFREQTQLFKQGIIPQAGQTVASMLAAYQVNKVDFLNLVQAQITLFNYETRYWQTLSQAQQALARLVAAVGSDGILGLQDEVIE